MRKTVFTLISISLLLLNQSQAADVNPVEIMKKNFAVSKPLDSISAGVFRLISADGQERIRKMTSKSKLKPGTLDNRRLVKFLSPADVKGTISLTSENSQAGKDDDIWIYLPALKKVRRLVSSNKKDSFVGTDLSYGDVIGFKVESWDSKISKEETFDAADCYVIVSTPKNAETKNNTGYSKRIDWIRKDNFASVKGEAYDLGGKLIKVIHLTNIKEVDAKNKKWVAMKVEALNVQTKHKTIIEFEKYEANKGVSDEEFTARAIESES